MASQLICPSCTDTVDPGDSGSLEPVCPGCGRVVRAASGCDVFVSYASEDLERAQQVSERLAGAELSHWLAPKRIGLGQDFLSEIEAALSAATVVVLLLSRYSVRSPWVRREISSAVGDGKAILPLRIDDAELPRDFRILLGHSQWRSASGDEFLAGVEELVACVRQELLNAAAAAQVPAEVPEPAPAALDEPELLGVDPGFSPYAGPTPFSAGMADRFFGRQQEARDLLQEIAAHRKRASCSPTFRWT